MGSGRWNVESLAPGRMLPISVAPDRAAPNLAARAGETGEIRQKAIAATGSFELAHFTLAAVGRYRCLEQLCVHGDVLTASS